MDKLRGKVILVVDDDDRNIFALQSYLEMLDINVMVAKNGSEAIAMLNDPEKPDLILLDMMMPVMDGFETLGILKTTEYLKDIPVISVTAKAMKGDMEKCMAAGAWDYISKPVDLNLLNEKMIKWVR